MCTWVDREASLYATCINEIAQNTFFHINFDKNSTFHASKRTNELSREQAKQTNFHASKQNKQFFTSKRTIFHASTKTNDRRSQRSPHPNCCEIKQLRSNICYEFSEQYQLGTILQNSNLNVVKTSTEASTSCRDASANVNRDHVDALVDRPGFNQMLSKDQCKASTFQGMPWQMSIGTTWCAVPTSMGFFHSKMACNLRKLTQFCIEKTFRSKIFIQASKRSGVHRDTPIQT